MRVADLALPPDVVAALNAQGYDALWPSQEQAAPIAVSGGNLMLAVPTASGKSLVAYLALLKTAAKGGKGLYLVPLRALASEKFEDLKELGASLGLRVALATGDLDEPNPELAKFDLIVATSEKADALLRHRAGWLTRVGAIVADEVHLLNEPDRGPTLEVLLTRFKQLNPSAQIVALSATVANAREIADWLGATLVQTDWRPVKLNEGILFGRGIQFLDNEVRKVDSDRDDASSALVEDAVKGGGQCLVFVNTRKSTEALADKLRPVVAALLKPEERARLKEIADGIAKEGADPETDFEKTTVERKLARAVAGGVAFHHAGLRGPERAAVEKAFKGGLLKAITATPTLAAGINLPARRVIIRDVRRFDSNEGSVPIPVLDYKQMAGRAGRPRYDKVGEAITIAKSREEKEDLLLSYLLADPEKVRSQLSREPALRAHLLSSIATGYVTDEATLKGFVSHTFFAHQADAWRLDAAITQTIDFLLENDLVVAKGAAFEATLFGRRVSELYVDPLSAVKLRAALRVAGARARASAAGEGAGLVGFAPEAPSRRATPPRPASRAHPAASKARAPGEAVEGGFVPAASLAAEAPAETPPLAYLHAVCATPDMRPLYMRRQDAWVEAEAMAHKATLLSKPGPGDDYDFFLSELKTALLLEDWILERTEAELMEKYNAYPGDILNKVETAEWLLYAMGEIARVYERGETRAISTLRTRLRHGAKAELIPLLALRGVGRHRARALFDHGYKAPADLAKADLADLVKIKGIGRGLATSILKQVGTGGGRGAEGREAGEGEREADPDRASGRDDSASDPAPAARGTTVEPRNAQARLGDFTEET